MVPFGQGLVVAALPGMEQSGGGGLLFRARLSRGVDHRFVGVGGVVAFGDEGNDEGAVGIADDVHGGTLLGRVKNQARRHHYPVRPGAMPFWARKCRRSAIRLLTMASTPAARTRAMWRSSSTVQVETFRPRWWTAATCGAVATRNIGFQNSASSSWRSAG